MRGEHHRSPLVDERAQQVPELEDARRVEAVHRLVEDEQVRVREQAARDAEALAHAHRVRLHAIACAVRQPDALDRRPDALKGVAPARGGDDAREGLGTALGHRQPAQAHRPAVRARQAEEHADQRRLPGAVGTEVAERDAAGDAEVDALDHRAAAEALRQAACLDDVLGLRHEPTLPGATASAFRGYVTSSSRGFGRSTRPTFAAGRPSTRTMSAVKSFAPRRSDEPMP